MPFRVVALVTVSDIEFNLESINFGTCTIHESVIVTIKLTNKSVLPQKFGFIDLPQVYTHDWIAVNDVTITRAHIDC